MLYIQKFVWRPPTKMPKVVPFLLLNNFAEDSFFVSSQVLEISRWVYTIAGSVDAMPTSFILKRFFLFLENFWDILIKWKICWWTQSKNRGQHTELRDKSLIRVRIWNCLRGGITIPPRRNSFSRCWNIPENSESIFGRIF